jgi:hypothetical protein
MNWLTWAAAASGWVAAVGLLFILSARAARRETSLALRLRAVVEPCMLRRAQELGVEAAVTGPATDRLDELVGHLCGLAERLTVREKDQFTETQRIAVAQTVPIEKPRLDE